MIDILDKRRCVGCGNCAIVCPVSCISLHPDEEGFLYPIADKARCISCNKCHDVCPVELIIAYPNRDTEKIIAANHKDDALRLSSSSGAAFYELAKYVLNNNGFVWGAAFVSGNDVKHVCISSLDDIALLQKSKYVQSDITHVFLKIRKQLSTATRVLFSGTPCQIKALYAYLKARPKNLLTVEVVCHGVPSPSILKRYLVENGIKAIDFRKKENGWSDYDVELRYNTGEVSIEKAKYNLYMRGFLKNLYLRPSCFKCPAKAFKSTADITLGDFWGVEVFVPKLADDKGTSLVFLHSPMANDIWQSIKHCFKHKPIKFDQTIIYNPSIVLSPIHTGDREKFFKTIKTDSIMNTLQHFFNDVIFQEQKTADKLENISMMVRLKMILLFFWNIAWNVCANIKKIILISFDRLYLCLVTPPQVIPIEDTILHIIDTHCSVSRYGDGEMKFICGGETWFQKNVPELQKRLKEILNMPFSNHIVCIPPVFDNLNIYKNSDKKYWAENMAHTRRYWYKYIDRRKCYHNAFISRCYMPYKDKSNAGRYFQLWKQVWDGRNIIIVEGEKSRLGVGNDLFDNVKTIKRILCPNTQAFEYYERLLNEVMKYDKKHLILLAVGPSATVLAADLSVNGYQAIDIGHIDIEYEWYLTGAMYKMPVADKFVNEAGAGIGVGDIDDIKYKKEIVCRF